MHPDERRKVFRNLIIGGVYSGIMTHLVTGVLIVKLALDLGAGATIIGLIAAIPLVAYVIQVPAAMQAARSGRPKKYTLMGSALYRLGIFLLIPAPWIKPDSAALGLLLFAVLCQGVGAAWSNGGWNLWTKALIPRRFLARVVSRKLNLYTLAGTLTTLAAAAILDAAVAERPDLLRPALSVFFAVAFAASLIVFRLFMRLPDVRTKPEVAESLTAHLTLPFKNPSFRHLVGALVVLLFGVQMAQAFFPVVLLQTLGYPVSVAMALWAFGQLMHLPFYLGWGWAAERFSHTTSLAAALPFFGAGLLVWVVAADVLRGPFLLPVLVLAHALIGIGMAGITLMQKVILIKMAPRQNASAYMSAGLFLVSVISGLGPVVGGLIVDTLAHTRWLGFDSYGIVFGLSFTLVMGALPFLARVEEPGKVPLQLAHRLMRQHGALMLRQTLQQLSWRQLAETIRRWAQDDR
jgi:MFS family permease